MASILVPQLHPRWKHSKGKSSRIYFTWQTFAISTNYVQQRVGDKMTGIKRRGPGEKGGELLEKSAEKEFTRNCQRDNYAEERKRGNQKKGTMQA